MQTDLGFCTNGCIERMPFASIIAISPGSSSRTYSASIRSKAHVSEATHHESFSLPKTSGRKPLGSRTAISSFGVRKSIEKAPSVSARTFVMASMVVGASVRAMLCKTVSVSEVDEKIAPERSSSARFAAANGKLPL